jgi:hypothetical protein
MAGETEWSIMRVASYLFKMQRRMQYIADHPSARRSPGAVRFCEGKAEAYHDALASMAQAGLCNRVHVRDMHESFDGSEEPVL